MIALTQSPCVNSAEGWCATIFGLTGNTWLAKYSGVLIVRPLSIIAIAVVALVLRYVLHRMIDQLCRGDGNTPKILRPLKERLNEHHAATALVAQRRAQRARTIGSVLKSTASFLIFGLAIMYALQQLGVELAPLLASAGVLGVAVAFGAQNLVRDFLSGIFMMAEDQYGVGDVVDLGTATGTIESVGMRITTLRDGNGTVWYVRNGEIQRVGNQSQGYAVAVIDFPISYSSNVAKAIDVASQVASEATTREPLAADVLEPPEMLGVDKLTVDAVTLRLTVKVRPGRQWAVQRALRAEIKRAYDDEDIRPPYPAGWSGQPITSPQT